MSVQITFKQMDSSESLKTKINEQSDKLKKFLPTHVELTWILYKEADVHVADLIVKGPHVDLFGQSKSGDMYTSVEGAFERVEKQLKKQKEMLKDHLHKNR